MTVRSPRYLYVREAFPVVVNGLGAGKVVTAKMCANREGDPAPIGTLTTTLAPQTNPEDYSATFARAAILGELTTAGKLGARIYLHLDDGVVWHDVWPLQVTDVDPDLLPPLKE